MEKPTNRVCRNLQVCLVYEAVETINPKIYLLELPTMKWQFLADTFTEYLRMSIVHLGLPYWELTFAESCHLPTWAEQLFLLIAPHLIDKKRQRCHIDAEPIVYNTLDASIFRTTKPKCGKQTQKKQ